EQPMALDRSEVDRNQGVWAGAVGETVPVEPIDVVPRYPNALDAATGDVVAVAVRDQHVRHVLWSDADRGEAGRRSRRPEVTRRQAAGSRGSLTRLDRSSVVPLSQLLCRRRFAKVGSVPTRTASLGRVHIILQR